MTLAELNASVRSREDFVAFARALSNDLRTNRASWENASLDRYIEALGAWVADMDGYYLNQDKPAPQLPDWKVVADMLMAARHYE